jgi:hypothetical protein
VERSGPAAVPFEVIGVPFRRDAAASSARSVAFSFTHTNDMPGYFAFSSFPFAEKCSKTPAKSGLALTINIAFSSEVDAGSREENASKRKASYLVLTR